MNPISPDGWSRVLAPFTNEPIAACGLDVPDRRDGSVYLCDEDTQLAVEVALTTGRPLLLRGDPGSGKSSLAAFVARNLGWRYFEHVVTGSMRAEDLLWRYDAVRRLSDAQVRQADDPPLNDAAYIEPGILWWVLDPDSAQRRGATREPWPAEPDEPNADVNRERDQERAVILIDELDKADPDVPNSLLVPLGSMRFRVNETGAQIARSSVPGTDETVSRLLVVITTNEERELPPAFMRRCVVHTLEHPNPERLVDIARLHFGEDAMDADFGQLCLTLAKRVCDLRERAEEQAARPPSTAEYLDAVRACHALELTLDSPVWDVIERVTLAKRDRPAQR